MSKLRRVHTHNPSQLDLRFAPEYGVLGDALDQTARHYAEAIRRSPFSREQICDRLAAMVGREASLAQLNAWTAETNRNRMPCDVAVALAYILKDFGPFADILAPLGLSLADARERALAELGRLTLEKETIAAREDEVRRIINGGK
jgi:hypothetical protein